MSSQRFRATVTRSGDKTYIVLPFDPNTCWGVKPRHHIRGMVDGCPIRGPLGFDGATFTLPLGAAWLREKELPSDAAVDVVLEPEGPQFADLAPDVLEALDAEPDARAFFEGLATFYRKGYLRWIDSTRRRPDLRAARVAEVIALLKAGKKQR